MESRTLSFETRAPGRYVCNVLANYTCVAPRFGRVQVSSILCRFVCVS